LRTQIEGRPLRRARGHERVSHAPKDDSEEWPCQRERGHLLFADHRRILAQRAGGLRFAERLNPKIRITAATMMAARI